MVHEVFYRLDGYFHKSHSRSLVEVLRLILSLVADSLNLIKDAIFFFYNELKPPSRVFQFL